jgi:peptidoglycan/xylan/chitin deacetylase (PgdA/CDA1 family)
MKYFYTPPWVVQCLLKKYIWKSKKDKVVLTFDDGPDPLTTEIILKILNELKIKALFFCIGNNLNNYPELGRIIVSEGHTIGNHSFSHRNLRYLTKQEAAKEIIETNELIYKLQKEKNYFRPPYGKIPFYLNTVLSELSIECIMWSLLALDYKNEMKYVKFAIKNYLKKNSIVVLHDSQKSSRIIEDSIKFINEEVVSKGFQFGEPSECLN